jgi:hypothetical protein
MRPGGCISFFALKSTCTRSHPVGQPGVYTKRKTCTGNSVKIMTPSGSVAGNVVASFSLQNRQTNDFLLTKSVMPVKKKLKTFNYLFHSKPQNQF